MYDVPDGSVLSCRGMKVGRLPRERPLFSVSSGVSSSSFSSFVFISALSLLIESFSRLFSFWFSLFSSVISISFVNLDWLTPSWSILNLSTFRTTSL